MEERAPHRDTIYDHTDNPKSSVEMGVVCPDGCGGQAVGQTQNNQSNGMDENMALSVTRHVQNPQRTEWELLSCGIDTLDLGVYVNWNNDWEDKKDIFQARKELAFGTDGILVNLTETRKYLFLPGGKQPNYRYHLQFPEYHIFIAISEEPKNNSPNVFVSINSEALWSIGYHSAVIAIWQDITVLGGRITLIKPSRVDICADYRITGGLDADYLKKHKVGRSIKTLEYKNGDILESIYFGVGKADIKLRIYNKGLEITKKDTEKRWLEIWNTDNSEDVWRIEYQIRRSILKQYKIETLDDLEKTIADIWEYLTTEWFSLRHLDNEKTERRTYLEFWQDVINCKNRFGEISNIKREYRKTAHRTLDPYVSRMAGLLIGYAVISQKKNQESALRNAMNDIAMYLSNKKDFKEEYEKKAIKLGLPTETLMESEGAKRIKDALERKP